MHSLVHLGMMVTAFLSSPQLVVAFAPSPGRCQASSVLYGKGKGDIMGALSGQKRAPKAKQPQPAWSKVDGVSIPEVGNMKAWQLPIAGADRRFVCARPKADRVYLVDGECTRCAFDLWRGTMTAGDSPKVACPVCRETFSLLDGEPMGVAEKGGFEGWVGGLARTATTNKVVGLRSYPIKVTRTTEGTVGIEVLLFGADKAR
jgi:nitrite reductase/ring-hydroxylating ferredoxin subunit